jgi:hypothetical protein
MMEKKVTRRWKKEKMRRIFKIDRREFRMQRECPENRLEQRTPQRPEAQNTFSFAERSQSFPLAQVVVLTVRSPYLKISALIMCGCVISERQFCNPSAIILMGRTYVKS